MASLSNSVDKLDVAASNSACISQDSTGTKKNDLQGQYWLTRVYYLRYFAFLYLNAFLVAYFQNQALIGEKGLTPAIAFLQGNRGHFATPWQAFMAHPTLFWFILPSTANLNLVALLGAGLSLIPLLHGAANLPIMAALWLLYFSIVNVGQTWYSFGWESQVLEIGFLAMFLVPLWSLRRFPLLTPTPWVTVWGNRWLLFRIMIGAGMIKIRGDSCWTDLTCMNYHYQTQPNPNPLSVYFHSTPEWFHRAETMVNHVIELAAPWLLLVPYRPAQMTGAVLQVLFQITIIVSGNLAFLNWLTIVPALMSLDDSFWAHISSAADLRAAREAEEQYQQMAPAGLLHAAGPKVTLWSKVSVWSRRMAGALLLAVLALGSYPVLTNLLSDKQAMNTSFGAFRLVNSYGAFGSVTKVRHEVVLQGTREVSVGPHTHWQEIGFVCKPGDLDRAPCVISPYHLRLDWLMWFAAFQSYQHCPWLVHLGYKLLQGDLLVNELLGHNPFYNATMLAQLPAAQHSSEEELREIVRKYHAPRYLRAMLYEYQYTPLQGAKEEEGWEVGRWYRRRLTGQYMPTIALGMPSLQDFLKAHRYIT